DRSFPLSRRVQLELDSQPLVVSRGDFDGRSQIGHTLLVLGSGAVEACETFGEPGHRFAGRRQPAKCRVVLLASGAGVQGGGVTGLRGLVGPQGPALTAWRLGG